MDLTGLAAFGGSAVQGYDAAQQRRQQLAVTDLQLQEARRKVAAEAAALSGLTAMDQGGGPPQPQPMQTAPMPGGPPMSGGASAGPPMSGGASALPMAPGGPGPGTGAPPAPGGAPMSQPGGMPPGGAPGAAPGMGGGYTISQLARVIKAKNPGLDDATVFRAVVQAQQLLNPVEKQMLQYLMSQQRVGATERGQDIRASTAAAGQENQANIAAGNQATRLQGIGMQQQGAETRVGEQQAGADRRAGSGTTLTPEAIANAGTILRHTGHIPAFGRSGGKGDRQAIINWASDQNNKDDPTALSQLGSQMQQKSAQVGANAIARLESQVAVGAAELPQTIDKIKPIVASINTSTYPNINALRNWFATKSGSPETVALQNYVAQVQAAAQLIRSRGGQVTDKVRNAAEQVMNGSMPTSQIVSAGQTLITEAEIVRKATSSAMGETIQRGLGGGEGGAGAGEGQADPLGIR